MDDLYDIDVEAGDNYIEPVSPLDVSVLWRRLIELDFAHTASVISLEQDMYLAIKSFPDEIAYSIMMAQIQLMLGNIERARSFAYKIWENGGDTLPQIKILYLQILITLNMPEMAAELAHDFMDIIDDISPSFYSVLLNFAVAFGKRDVIEILAARIEEFADGPLYAFIDFCNQNKFWPCLKYFSGFIFHYGELYLADYSAKINGENDKFSLNIVFFASQEVDETAKKINSAIFDFCKKNNIPTYDNIVISVKPLSNHPRLSKMFSPV